MIPTQFHHGGYQQAMGVYPCFGSPDWHSGSNRAPMREMNEWLSFYWICPKQNSVSSIVICHLAIQQAPKMGILKILICWPLLSPEWYSPSHDILVAGDINQDLWDKRKTRWWSLLLDHGLYTLTDGSTLMMFAYGGKVISHIDMLVSNNLTLQGQSNVVGEKVPSNTLYHVPLTCSIPIGDIPYQDTSILRQKNMTNRAYPQIIWSTLNKPNQETFNYNRSCRYTSWKCSRDCP